jgi:tetratricopeptide (TPR) repeat protein
LAALFGTLRPMKRPKPTLRGRQQRAGLVFLLLGLVAVCLLLVAANPSALAWRAEQARAAWLDLRSNRGDSVPTPVAHERRPTAAVSPEAVSAAYEATRPATTTVRPTSDGVGPPTAVPPTPTQAPLPKSAALTGFRFEFQDINNCGPTTLAMALSYWGWEGTQTEIAEVIKPVARDKNVRWDELIYYVQNRAGWLDALFRVGGTPDIVKRFIASGYPIIIATGYTIEQQGWVGHYLLLSGYDDEAQTFTVQDATGGPDRVMAYAAVDREWQQFNRLFLVVFPTGDRETILTLLGPDADQEANRQHALEMAQAETEADPQNAYAWFNLGSNLNYFDRYAEAAAAYDQARTLGLPWRMMFYQFGPYRAYFNTGRYQDVIDVADAALGARPDLEENFYWRGWARYMQDDSAGAISDFREALKVNPNFSDARSSLEELGATP